jgi:hypothetical protein
MNVAVARWLVGRPRGGEPITKFNPQETEYK